MAVVIREADVNDAEGMIKLNQRLSLETDFMLMEPAEVTSSTDDQRNILQRVSSSDHEQLLVATEDERLVGFVAAYRKRFNRVRHCFSVVIGVEQYYWGRGVGKRLMYKIENWAKSRGAERLELTVLEQNERAMKLYLACGFVLEGRRRGSMRLAQELVDELYMAKLL